MPSILRVRNVLLVGTFGLLACDPSGPTGNNTGPPGADPPTLAASVAAQSGSDGYGGVGYLFSPGTVSILVGGTVTWSNSSGDAHTVTFPGAAGNPLDNGTQYARTFNAAGSYGYSCSLHGGMSGTVTVTSP